MECIRWMIVLDSIVKRKGGFRERDIYEHQHHVERGETWNKEHKVLKVISDFVDDDGHRDSFDVDIVTERICG